MGRSSRLWDDEGDEWSLLGPIAPTEAEAMLKDPAIRVAIHDDFAEPIRWLVDRDRENAVRAALAPWFRPQGDARQLSRRKYQRIGRLFNITVWQMAERRLLLFDAD
jgi:hypothetical protein